MFLPLSIAHMLWKRKLAIAAITLGGGALSGLAIHHMPSIYSAEAVVLIESQKIPEKFVSSTVSMDMQDRIAAMSQEILSSGRLEKIISDFGLYREESQRGTTEDALERMRKDVSIQMDRTLTATKPGAFRISYRGKDPSVVAAVANRIANLFIEGNDQTREVQVEGTSEFLDRQLAEAKARLDDLEAQVGRFKAKYNGELPEQQAALISTLQRLDAELQANRDALNRAQESKSILESNLAAAEASLEAAAAVNDRPTETAVAPSPAASQQKASEALEAKLNTLLARYGPGHPDVKRVQAELAAQKAVEAAEEVPAPPAAVPGAALSGLALSRLPQEPARQEAQAAQANERLASLRAQIGAAKNEIAFRAQEQERIAAEMKENSERINRLPLREQQMAQVTRDYEISKTNYRNLLDKKLAAEMAADLEHRDKPERLTLLDPARVPEKPERPNRPLLYAMGGLLSVALGLACGLGLEARDGRLLGEWELAGGIPVIASVPKIVVERRAPAFPGVRPWATRVSFILAAILVAAGLAAAAGWYTLAVRR
ncbi:MAG TPA: Wzz/FepE/Etk N-terminal domain-containing protein [Bryobacteraceae bacterium]|nr:Wzz/FepE/Etk N-terminal domain-containing protein [Bryobacteraceae bacterium]